METTVDAANRKGVQWQSWIVALLCQGVFLPLFLVVVGLQDTIVTNLTERQFDPVLIASVPMAFQQYVVAVVALAAFLSMVALAMRQDKVPFLPDIPPLHVVALSFFAYFLTATRLLQFPISIDDSYIDYRYVINTLHNLPLQYNAGERIIGFTSYVHLWLLLFLSWISREYDISRLSQLANCLMQLAAYFLSYPILTKTFNNSRNLALLGTVLVASSSDITSQGTLGKESSIVLLLLVLLLHAVNSEKPRLIAWCGTLLFLTRPEGIIALILTFAHTIRKGKQLIRIWWAPLLLLAVWHAFLYIYFGSIIPHGGEAKRLAYAHTPPGVCLFNILFQFAWMLNPFGWSSVFETTSGNLQKILLVVQGVFMLVLVAICARHANMRLYCLIVLAMVAAFAVGNAHMFEWYLCWYQCVPMIVVPSIVQFLWKLPFPRLVSKSLVAIAVCHFIVAPWFWPILRTQGYFPGISGLMFGANQFDLRVLPYKRAAEYMNQIVKPGEVVAVTEIGMFGYSYRGSVLDTNGLVSEVLKYYLPKGASAAPIGYTVPPKLIKELRPKYFLTFDGFIKYGLDPDPWFHQAYRVKKEWRHQLLSSSKLVLFERNDGEEATQ